MTRDEAIEQISQILGFRTDREVSLTQKILTEQTAVEDALVDDVPWFLHTKTTLTSTLESGVYNKIAPPTDYLALREDDRDFWLLDATSGKRSVQVLRADAESVLQMQQMGNWTVSGTDPEVLRYYLVADSIYVGPHEFTTARSFQFGYYKRGTALDSNIENEWLKHVPKVLIGKTALEEATVLRDQPAAENAQRVFEEGLVQLARQNEARRLQGGSYQMEYTSDGS